MYYSYNTREFGCKVKMQKGRIIMTVLSIAAVALALWGLELLELRLTNF